MTYKKYNLKSSDLSPNTESETASPVSEAQTLILKAIDLLESVDSDATILAIGKLKGALEKLSPTTRA